MKKHFSILQGTTRVFYHTIPSELNLISLPPEREAIFKYLARIGPEKFVEFILDILVLVEKHKPIDITDGAGDEKQDILTLTPTGSRHLTQCKHTLNYKDHYAGDELDLLFGACVRKNCTNGLLVTNSDLTTQGKRYITDKEYTRGSWIPKELLPDLDYWNGGRIWDRVAKNNVILNKWFSGMGQAHGLRHFFFDLVIQKMPSGVSDSVKCADVADNLAKKYRTAELGKKSSYEVQLGSGTSLNISDWFHSDLNLGLPYVPPGRQPPLVNIPLASMRVQVTVADGIGQYNPATFRDSIVQIIANEALPALPDTQWWHLIATTPQAFVFLHDIVEPKVIPVAQAQSYVRILEHPTSIEQEWVFPQGQEYIRVSEGREDELVWHHTASDTDVTLLLSQTIHPVKAYEHYMLQLRSVSQLPDYELCVIPRSSQEIIERVHRLMDPRGILMLGNDSDLLLAFPPMTNDDKIREIEATLKRQGIAVYRIAPKNRGKILKRIEIRPPNISSSLNMFESDINVPIWLNRRTLWLSKEVAIKSLHRLETWLDLLKFKAEYESQHGFDFMRGKKKITTASEEIRRYLFDILSVRGNRMLDLGFNSGKMTVNLRIRESSSKSTNELLPTYLEDLDRIVKDILVLIETSEGGGLEWSS